MDPDRKLVAEGAAQIEQAQKKWLKSRGPLLLAVAVGALTILSLTSIPRWRIVAAGCAFVVMIVGAQVIYLRWLGVGHSAKRQLMTVFPLGFAVGMVNTLLTGGLNSPIIVLAMAPLIAFALIADRHVLRWMLAALVCVMASFLLLPLSFTTGLFTPLEFRIVAAYSVICFAGVTALTLIQNQRMVGEMTLALERARSDLLEAAAERKRALEMLGAKVAHELRNPLAAMKALVALESRNPGSQKSSARLEVVLGEIARMEQILRDYLSSSRPLEDLELAPVQLETIADEAVSSCTGASSRSSRGRDEER